jgi:hypothetical protein
MRSISLVLVVASVACYREAAPPPPAPSPLANKVVPSAEAAASTDILAFLPIDSEFVMRIDVKAVRTSALWAEYQPQISAAIGKGLAEMQATCGFDPIHAVDSVTVGVRDFDASDAVVVVRGFDRDLFFACMEAQRVPSTLITNDHGILTFARAGQRTHLAGFADRSTLVFDGSQKPTRESLRTLLRSGAPLRHSPGFLALLRGVETDAALWFLMNGNASALRSADMGIKPRSVYGAIHVAHNIAALGRVRVESADQAVQLAAAADVQLQRARPLFDKLTATSEGDVITIACEMSSAQLRSLIAIASSVYKGFGVKP